jgi:hypothetical protein
MYSGITCNPAGNAASTKPVPGGYCSTFFFDAGIGVWQGALAGLLHSG